MVNITWSCCFRVVKGKCFIFLCFVAIHVLRSSLFPFVKLSKYYHDNKLWMWFVPRVKYLAVMLSFRGTDRCAFVHISAHSKVLFYWRLTLGHWCFIEFKLLIMKQMIYIFRGSIYEWFYLCIFLLNDNSVKKNCPLTVNWPQFVKVFGNRVGRPSTNSFYR